MSTPSKITPTTLVSRNGTPVEASVGEEVVLMLLERGECIGLGDTGSEVWRLLAEPLPFATLLAQLHNLYDAPEGTIEQDTTNLLRHLQTLHLITLT